VNKEGEPEVCSRVEWTILRLKGPND